MNLIRARRFCKNMTTFTFDTNSMIELLSKRSLLRVQGNEVISFMQGLITNDMNHLVRGSPGIYTMFLNKPGRVLYDSIIYKTKEENTFFIECDTEISKDLKKHLQLFRVRRKISIDTIEDDFKIWTIFDSNLTSKDFTEKQIFKIEEHQDLLLCTDPRLKNLGTRIIAPTNYDNIKISNILNLNLVKSSGSTYKNLRYKLGIGEGIIELPIGKCFPLESNCDYLHGISFHKGCYLGQEFTARTHHTGVIRKRLMPLQLSEHLNSTTNEIKSSNGKVIGILRGYENLNGLTLIKVDAALSDAKNLFADNVTCKTSRPCWWPQEALKEKVITENIQSP